MPSICKWFRRMFNRGPALPSHHEYVEAVTENAAIAAAKAKEVTDEIIQDAERVQGALHEQRRLIAKRDDVLSQVIRAMRGEPRVK